MTINVALVSSGVLGDLVFGVLERDSGFDLIARAEDVVSAVRLCGDSELHALVVGTPTGALPRAAGELLGSGACRVVISIADDGKQTWLQAAGRDPRPLGDLSPELLLAAIRDGVVADGGPACA